MPFGSSVQYPWQEGDLQVLSIICKRGFFLGSYRNRLVWLQPGPSTVIIRSKYRYGKPPVLLRVSDGNGKCEEWSYSTADPGLDATRDLTRYAVLRQGSSSCFA